MASCQTDSMPEVESDSPVAVASTDERLLPYEGRYSNGPFSLFSVEAVDEFVAIVPPFWTSKPYLQADGIDEFYMAIPHIDRDRRVHFIRNEAGEIVALEAFGFDGDSARFDRVSEEIRLPVELVLEGRVDEALSSLDVDPSSDPDRWATVARRFVVSYPTRSREALVLLDGFLERGSNDPQLHALRGYALLAADRREEALAAFESAIELDPGNGLANDAIRRLRASEPTPGEGYRALFPYDLGALFEAPTREEIEKVRTDWSLRDLRPREVETVATETLELAHSTYTVRIVRHVVHGDEHYGAVLTPRGAADGSLPVIVEARGVDPEYTPQDLSEGTQLMRALGDLQPRFLFVIPSFRGETLELHDHSFTSSGDRSDSWDGATDDMIALLNVALETEPAADPERIAAYGKSRGGSVALLTGIRDDRIDLALNLAGPTDWFRAMENRFWSTHETLRDQLSDGEGLTPTQEGGQFYERFIAPVARGDGSLEDARLSMLAGSPLYFAESLPRSYSFYGAEDRSVPVLNAELLKNRMDEIGAQASAFHLTIYPERGHDTEPYLAFRSMVGALEELLDREP